MLVATLSDLVFQVREVSSGRSDLLTVHEHGRRQPLSTADFLRGVHSLALALDARGLTPEDRVAIYFENRPEWHIVDFACQLLGASTVPISPSLPPQQVGFILRNSACRRVFFGNVDQRNLLLELAPSLTSPPEIIALDGDDADRGGTSITRLMGEGAALLGEVPIERFRGRARTEGIASIDYVTDPEDDPRGVETSHREAISRLHDYGESFAVTAKDSAISDLPLSRVFQRTLDHLCFHRGARLHYVSPGGDIEQTVRREHPTLLAAGPGVYENTYLRALERFPLDRPWRRRVFRWAIETGQRYEATRGGFINPFLGLQRKLADYWVYRDCRQILGGRLRRAISGGERLSEEATLFFEAVGIPLVQVQV